MRFFSIIIVFLLLASSVSAECRNKDCMPNERVVTEADQNGGSVIVSGFEIYYDNVFEIGTTWFVIFEYGSSHANGSLEFNFGKNLIKNLTLQYDGGIATDSVSFSGTSFINEEPHKKLFVNFSSEKLSWSVELDIFVNKPPSEDMIYLWGGMTVFWLGIGAYVVYLSNKFQELSDKSGLGNGDRKKN